MPLLNLFKKRERIPLGNMVNSVNWYPQSILQKLFSKLSTTGDFKHFVEQGFGRNPHVYSVVNHIAEVTSRLPYELYKGDKLIESGNEYELIQRPNKQASFDEFLYKVVAQFLTTGNAYILKRSVSGLGIAELEVLPAQKIEIKVNTIGEITKYVLDIESKKIPYEPEDILHIKMPNIIDTNPKLMYYGTSPLQAAMMVYVASNDIYEAEASIFKNRGVVGFLTNDSEVPMLAKDRIKLQEDFQREVSGADLFGKIAISNQKLRYVNVGMSPSDLKIIESSISKLRTICSIYGVDSSLFNDPENKTYNNRAEAQRAFYNDVVIPLADKISRTLSLWLFDDIEIIVNTNKIDAIKDVNTELSKRVIEEVKTGIISIDEAREILEI